MAIIYISHTCAHKHTCTHTHARTHTYIKIHTYTIPIISCKCSITAQATDKPSIAEVPRPVTIRDNGWWITHGNIRFSLIQSVYQCVSCLPVVTYFIDDHQWLWSCMGDHMSSLGHLHVKRGHVLHNIVTSSNSCKQPIHNSLNDTNHSPVLYTMYINMAISLPIVAFSAGTKLPICVHQCML